MKTAVKGDFTNIVKPVKTKKKLSLLERVMKNIPEGRYKDLDKILEPHEIPRKNKVSVKPKAVKKKLSLMELVMKNIPKDRYRDLDLILEPHEISTHNNL